MSLSKFLQMIGRGLRPAPNKEHLIIIDHVGNVTTHGLPDAKRKWTLDRILKKQDKTNLIRICSNIMCNAPYDRTLQACPWCGEPAFKPTRDGGGGRLVPKEVDGDLELLDADTLRKMFEKTQLESPEAIARRVGAVAGAPAGIKAARNQTARIETQKDLVNVIAKWAGHHKHHGHSDRSIHKMFYLQFERTITEALSEPRADMLVTISQLKEEINL